MSSRRSSTVARTPRRRNAASRGTASTLVLVREGVRRFILNDASIGDFHRALRKAARRGEMSPNPLTGAAFRMIVKEAIEERKRRMDEASLQGERNRQS